MNTLEKTSNNVAKTKNLAKKIFGRLLIKLRTSNNIKLYSLMGAVSDTKLVDNVIKLFFSDNMSYTMLNNQDDIVMINTILNDIQSGVTCELECTQVAFDTYEFESFLKDDFGKIVTIK